MKDYFEIVTLRDCMGCKKKGRYALKDGNWYDPVSIIIGGVQTILDLFGIGNKSRRLTQSDWANLFPTNGYWNNRLRSYLASHISWDTDLKNIEKFTEYFIHENLYEISGGKWANRSTLLSSNEWNEMVNKFYSILSSESKSSPKIEPGQAGIKGDMSLVSWLLIGGLAFAFMSAPTKSRKKVK